MENMQPMPAASPEAESLIYLPPSYFERLNLAQVFPQEQPLEVELGSGDGGFLLAWAQAHPERNFLGVERLLGRLRKLDRKGRRAGLQNVRGLRLEAGYTVEYLLPPETVSAFHIYFPDPWPKRKHRRHRLLQAPFAPVLARALLPGGVVYIRTDDADYDQQIRTVFAASDQFEPAETPPDLAATLTDFERDFVSRGIATRRQAWQRRQSSTF